MMKRLLALPFLFFSSFLQAQDLHIVWNKFFGGANSCYAAANYGIPTADKGILFVGRSNCNNSGDIPAFNTQLTYGNVLVGKVDSLGNLEWIKIYGSSGEDNAFGAVQTPDGGYAILGRCAEGDGDVIGFKGNEDIWLLRLDALGNLLWNKCFGSSGSDYDLGIANTPENGFIMLGSVSYADGDVPVHYGNSLTHDWLVVKTDSLGNKIWSKTIGGTEDEAICGSIICANGAYYIAGASNSIDYDCVDTNWHPNEYTNYDSHLLKLDTAGNVLWDRSYGGSSIDGFYDLVWDQPDGKIGLVGVTSSTDHMVNSNGGQKAWIVKVNTNGDLVWEDAVGISGQMIESLDNGIALLPNGGYICVSNLHSVLGGRDGFLTASDSSGTTISKVFGNSGNERLGKVVPFQNGYALIGHTTSLSFTEGINSGGYGVPANVFISYVAYFPTVVTNTELDSEFKIYPNPAKGRIRLQVGSKSAVRIVIWDTKGIEVFASSIGTNGMIDIDTSNWSKGSYVVSVENIDGSVLTKKIVSY